MLLRDNTLSGVADERLNECVQKLEAAERTLKILSAATEELAATREYIKHIIDDRQQTVDTSRSVPEIGGSKKAAIEEQEQKDSSTSLEAKEVSNSPVSSSTKQVSGVSGLETEEMKELVKLSDHIGDIFGLEADEVIRAYTCFCKAAIHKSGLVHTSDLRRLLEEVLGDQVDESAWDRTQLPLRETTHVSFEQFLKCYCNLPEKKVAHMSAYLNNDESLHHSFQTRVVGIPFEALVTATHAELEEQSACLSIPVVFMLFAFFVLSLVVHRQADKQTPIMEAIRYDIVENANFAFSGVYPFENGRMGHKSINDVNTYADFWSWFHLGLAPLFFPSGWSTSEARLNVASRCSSPLSSMSSMGWETGAKQANTPYGNGSFAAGTGDLGTNMCGLEQPTFFPDVLSGLNEYANQNKTPYLKVNEIIGGVRLRQEQVAERKCENDDYFGILYRTPCTESPRSVRLDPQSGEFISMRPELVNKPGGETVFFKSGSEIVEVNKIIYSLEGRRWLNQRTAKVEILLPIYNHNEDLFVAVYIDFFFSHAGHIFKVVRPVPIILRPYGNIFSYFIDAVFAILVLKLFVEEFAEICKFVRKKGCRKGCKKYFHTYTNILDWVSLFYSFIIFATWGVWLEKVVRLESLLKTASTDIRGGWPGPDDIYSTGNPEFWKTVDEVALYDDNFKIALGFYSFVIGARFFKAFSFQPRLAIVTRTLSGAGKDLAHFGIVLAVTMFVFTVPAYLLFGGHVDEFENLWYAYATVFRAMLGDFDYVATTESGRSQATIWWILFSVLVNLVMLNMLIAIIMDVYGRVQATCAGDEVPTVWYQASIIFDRWNRKRKGERLDVKVIVDVLEQHREEQLFETDCFVGRFSKARKINVLQSKLVTSFAFQAMVPSLSPGQADRLLGRAIDYLRRKSLEHFDATSSILQKMERVDLRMQYLEETLVNLDKGICSRVTQAFNCSRISTFAGTIQDIECSSSEESKEDTKQLKLTALGNRDSKDVVIL